MFSFPNMPHMIIAPVIIINGSSNNTIDPNQIVSGVLSQVFSYASQSNTQPLPSSKVPATTSTPSAKRTSRKTDTVSSALKVASKKASHKKPKWSEKETEGFVKWVLDKIYELKGNVNDLKCPKNFFEKIPGDITKRKGRELFYSHWNRTKANLDLFTEKYLKKYLADKENNSSKKAVAGQKRKETEFETSNDAEDVAIIKKSRLESPLHSTHEGHSNSLSSTPVSPKKNLSIDTTNEAEDDVIVLSPLNNKGMDLTKSVIPSYTLKAGTELVPVAASPNLPNLHLPFNLMLQRTNDADVTLVNQTTLIAPSEKPPVTEMSQAVITPTVLAPTLIDLSLNTSIASSSALVPTTANQTHAPIEINSESRDERIRNTWTQDEIDTLVEWVIPEINKNNFKIENVTSEFFKYTISKIPITRSASDTFRKWKSLIATPNFFERYDPKTGKRIEGFNLRSVKRGKFQNKGPYATLTIPEKQRWINISNVIKPIPQEESDFLLRLNHAYENSGLDDPEWSVDKDLDLFRKMKNK